MAEFFTTTGCAHQIEQLVTNARSKLYLISPYLRMPPTLVERLEETAQRGVQITLVYGKKRELAATSRAQLARISRLELRYLANLHAKCYASDTGILITSLNLHEYSEKHNREMGVLLNSRDEAYAPARREIESIVAISDEVPVIEIQVPPPVEKAMSSRGAERLNLTKRRSEVVSGFCIRCHIEIPLDADRPLCLDCFRTWNLFANDEYPERWCHECGREDATSMSRPRCISCYRLAGRAS